MTTWTRLALLSCFVIAIGSAPVSADTINVAEFRWDVDPTFIPGVDCGDDPDCLPTDPVAQSLYTLTGLWDYADVEAPTLNGTFSLSNGFSESWLPTNAYPLNVDQFPVLGFPDVAGIASASTSIFFDFLGQTINLGATLNAPGFAVLSFDYTPPVTPPNPVPEPGTLGLLGIGLAVLARTAAHRRRASNMPTR